MEALRSWGLPHETAGQVVAELAANAATHGRVPGRSFRLTLHVAGATLRCRRRLKDEERRGKAPCRAPSLPPAARAHPGGRTPPDTEPRRLRPRLLHTRPRRPPR
ncbi:hypothetical protein GCM10010421_64640 [Streptomyces glaucus]|uniref:Regulatory protein n=1 Tax=Streptomyces glaucus TaxID=284029 RepID=A0ABP5XSQ7_9ACTN